MLGRLTIRKGFYVGGYRVFGLGLRAAGRGFKGFLEFEAEGSLHR